MGWTQADIEAMEARRAQNKAIIAGNLANLKKGPVKARKASDSKAALGEAKKPIKHEESKMQIECVRWFRMQYKRELLFAVPNGSKLSGDSKEQIIRRGILKAEGLLSGVSDLVLVHDDGVAFLEAKTEKGTQSDTQRLFEAMVKAMGFTYLIFRNFDEFKNIVTQLIKK